MLPRLLVRWLIASIAVAAAVLLIPGIDTGPNALTTVIVAAAILGLVNALVKPLLQLLSCGLIIATLGLFLLVINAGTLLITSNIAQGLGIDFVVNGFWPAFWGAILISIVSFVLSIFISEPEPQRSDS